MKSGKLQLDYNHCLSMQSGIDGSFHMQLMSFSI